MSFHVQGQKNNQAAFDELELLFDSYKRRNFLHFFLSTIDSESFFNLNNRIKEILEENVCQLVADLQAKPNHDQLYIQIKANLENKVITKRPRIAVKCENLSNSIQSTLDLIQKVARFLQSSRKRERETNFRLKDVYKDELLVKLLGDLKNLKLPENIDEIRTISNPDIRASFIATIINRDYLPIVAIGLSKDELMLVAPHLTYLYDKGGLDEFLSKDEIDTFLKECKNLKTIIISSYKITHLPRFNFCELLNCKGCQNLTEIPDLPVCEEFYSHLCENLIEEEKKSSLLK